MQILLRVDGSCYRRYSPVVRSKQVRRCVLPMSRDSKQHKSAVHAQLAIAQPWYMFLLPIATCARSNGAIFASGEGSKSTPPPPPIRVRGMLGEFWSLVICFVYAMWTRSSLKTKRSASWQAWSYGRGFQCLIRNGIHADRLVA